MDIIGLLLGLVLIFVLLWLLRIFIAWLFPLFVFILICAPAIIILGVVIPIWKSGNDNLAVVLFLTAGVGGSFLWGKFLHKSGAIDKLRKLEETLDRDDF